jgi:hypothetical protein
LQIPFLFGHEWYYAIGRGKVFRLIELFGLEKLSMRDRKEFDGEYALSIGDQPDTLARRQQYVRTCTEGSPLDGELAGALTKCHGNVERFTSAAPTTFAVESR